jgi:hypothetical protein
MNITELYTELYTNLPNLKHLIIEKVKLQIEIISDIFAIVSKYKKSCHDTSHSLSTALGFKTLFNVYFNFLHCLLPMGWEKV